MPPKSRTIHLDALILKHFDYGEADRILVIYSKQCGKLRVIAKGIRKIRSRKAGHLEPFEYSKLFLSQGRDLPIVTQAQTIDTFSGISTDLLKIGYASYVIELVDRFSAENQENAGLFKLLLDTLLRIEKSISIFPPLQYFELNLLDIQGFKPELFHCVKCRETIKPEDQFFSSELGGVVCPRCGSNTTYAQPISMPALKYLRHYQRNPYSVVCTAQIPEATRIEMERLMRHYITFLLERKLNSPDFIRVVEHLGTLDDR